MTVSVRPWAEISADLRRWNMVLTREAADWGDALAAGVAATLPTCPTCGGTGNVWGPGGVIYATTVEGCPDCAGTGRGTVAQLVATWQAVHGGTLYDHMVTENQADRFITGWFAAYDHLRSVRPLSPKEGP